MITVTQDGCQGGKSTMEHFWEEFKQKKHQKQVDVYTWTQFTEGTCTGCLHLDPVQFQDHHPTISPKLHSSQVLALDDLKSLCVLLTIEHHQKQEYHKM